MFYVDNKESSTVLRTTNDAFYTQSFMAEGFCESVMMITNTLTQRNVVGYTDKCASMKATPGAVPPQGTMYESPTDDRYDQRIQ